MTTDPPIDGRLDELARSLRVEPDTGALWDRLQVVLDDSVEGPRAPIQPPRPRGFGGGWRGRVLLAAGFLALLSWSSLHVERGPGLLASGGEAHAFEGRLARLDAAIRSHRSALASTSAHQRPELAGQLAYLESNIEHCRELLLVNARNRDVQRSLLRSVQRKEELLRTLLEPDSES